MPKTATARRPSSIATAWISSAIRSPEGRHGRVVGRPCAAQDLLRELEPDTILGLGRNHLAEWTAADIAEELNRPSVLPADDAFAIDNPGGNADVLEGIVDVSAEPGSDLLRPRPIRHLAMIPR
jgi:hypothetical protein